LLHLSCIHIGMFKLLDLALNCVRKQNAPV
jgi:hypothetical protein